MIETLASALILAAISGLAALAVKHHDVYEQLSNKIFNGSVVLVIAVNAYLIGHGLALSKARKNIEQTEALEVLTNLDFGYEYQIYATAIFLAIMYYLMFLDHIGRAINKRKNQSGT